MIPGGGDGVDYVFVLQGAGEGGTEAQGLPVGGDELILICFCFHVCVWKFGLFGLLSRLCTCRRCCGC